jgi:hypothetical protein
MILTSQPERYTWRYDRFLDIAATPTEIARQLNQMQGSCNFTGSSKKSMATAYANQDTMGRPLRLGPVINDTIVETLLTTYGRKSQGAKIETGNSSRRRRPRR